MQRQQLEHIIRAATGITGAKEFIIIGSQAVLGQYPDSPAELLVSMEADLFSLRNPADADLIDGSIGEGSPFHHTFGYYAHGVAEETAVLPPGWKERLIPIQNENTGEKDLNFVRALLGHTLAKAQIIQERLKATSISADKLELCLVRLQKLSK